MQHNPTFTANAKQVLIDGEHMADVTSEESAQLIVDALNTSPLVKFDEAEKIGQQLHDNWHKFAPTSAPIQRDQLAWGDIVQFVLRMAFVAAMEREEA